MPLGTLGNPDGALRRQLERWRWWNQAAEPAIVNFDVNNEGLVIFDTTTKRPKVLYETGTANVMAWEALATAADVAAGFSGIVVDNTGTQVTLAGNGVAGTPLTANITDGTVVPADLEATLGMDDLPGVPTGPVAFGGQQINGLADGVAATDAVTLQQLNAAVAASAITGQYVGSSPTFAGLPSAVTNNGDWSILSADDGGNQSGIYVSNGAVWSLAKEIPEPFAVPAATEVVSGTLRIATQPEVTTGTDDTTAVTPLKLATALAAFDGVGLDAQNLTGAAANTNSVITYAPALNSTEIIQVIGVQLIAAPYGTGVGLPGAWGTVGQHHDFTDMVVAKTGTNVTLAIEDLVPLDNAFEIQTFVRL